MVFEQMKKDPGAFRGLPGASGKDGANGTNGVDGQPGSQAGFPALQVHLQDGDGETVETINVGPDGILRLPPVRMQIQHPDGRVFEQAKSLGSPIAVRLVPNK